jgi:hypothetical protein
VTIYKDIEANLVAWVKTVPGVVGSGTVLKTDATLPFVRVAKLGGTDDGITDAPLVDFDVFAATRSQARQIAEEIRDRLRPRIRAGSAIVDSVRTSVSPRSLPWDNSNIQMNGATYAIGLRR